MSAVRFWRVVAAVMLIALVAVAAQGLMQPAGADAADDMVRQLADLQRTLEETNRALSGIQSELAGLRSTVDRSGIFEVRSTTSPGGSGIPVVIQNP